MNVYRVRSICEVELSGGRLKQIYATVDLTRSKLNGLDWIEHFDGKPYTKRWPSVKFALDKPRLKRADFLNFNWNVLVCNKPAMEIVGDVLRGSGQIFPVAVAGEKDEHFFYNPTRMLRSAFDADAAQYIVLPTHKRMTAPGFRAEKIPANVSLFKIPQAPGIYCVERSGKAEDGEFRALVDQHGLTGLEFKLMWSDGQGATKQKATKGKTKVIKPDAPAAPAKSKRSDRPLKASEKKDVVLSIARGYEALKLKPTTPAGKTQKAIGNFIDSVVKGKTKLNSASATDAAVNIGCLWGQTVCDKAGWEWCYAKLNGHEHPAVASKERAHVVLPMHFVQRQLNGRKGTDNTSLLLFNMIKDKKLPPAQPRAYVTIG